MGQHPSHRHRRPHLRLRAPPQTPRQRLVTRKNSHGGTEWIPPPHLDQGQPRTNGFQYPEKLLTDDADDGF
ncbi:putative hNH endonuclease [Mycobacterium kansasii 824]|nr:putative hNH endonuclease [Mycobacterium kansasii 824]